MSRSGTKLQRLGVRARSMVDDLVSSIGFVYGRFDALGSSMVNDVKRLWNHGI